MIGAVIIGVILDNSPFKNRKHRGYVGLGFTAAACFAIWGATLSYQLTVSWADVRTHILYPTDIPYRSHPVHPCGWTCKPRLERSRCG
jgi:hypothetical protein